MDKRAFLSDFFGRSGTCAMDELANNVVGGARAEALLDWGQLEVCIVHELESLASPWTALANQCESTAFQSYGWCSSWHEAALRAGTRERPFIITITYHKKLVFLWPLVSRKLGPIRLLLPFGDPATQYCDALVDPRFERLSLLSMAWDEVSSKTNCDAFCLKGVREDSTIAILPVLVGERWVVRTAEAPFTDFRPNCPAGRPRRRSGRTRNALQRHLRNLGANGTVTFERIEEQTARVAAIREAVQLKHEWLRQKAQISAGYRHPANAMFLESLAAREDFLVARLGVGSDTAALEAGLLVNGRYWSLVQSYDLRYALHGPGRLLFWRIVEDPAAMGIEVLDFLAPAYPHKREWANGEVSVRDYVIPMTIRGRILLLYFRHIRSALKRSVQMTRKVSALSRRLMRRSGGHAI